MRFRMFLGVAACAPSLMAAASPVRLQPSTPWVVDYAEQSCRLIRKFGAGETETLLLFESEAPDEMDLVVVGRPLKNNGGEVPALFLPTQELAGTGRPVTTTDNGEPGVLFSRVRLLPPEVMARLDARSDFRKAHPHTRPPPLPPGEETQLRAARRDFAARATALEIDARRGKPVILETGSMGQPVAMFDQCSRDSLKDWGADPALEDKIVRPVWLMNHDTVIMPEDYPKSMLYQGRQSEVKVRVLVDSSGRVTKCTGLSHFKLPEFTELVCRKITQNGRFEPAELADGTRVASYYTVHINFRIR